MEKNNDSEPRKKRKYSKASPELKQLRKEMRRSKSHRIKSVVDPSFEYLFLSSFDEETLLKLLPGRVLQWVVSVDDISPSDTDVPTYFTREATVSPNDLVLDLGQGLITFRDTQKKQWYTVRTAKVFGIRP